MAQDALQGAAKGWVPGRERVDDEVAKQLPVAPADEWWPSLPQAQHHDVDFRVPPHQTVEDDPS